MLSVLILALVGVVRYGTWGIEVESALWFRGGKDSWGSWERERR
jgi:hypothetical protein